jgi:RNA-directed DNA polymerase
MTKPHYPQGCLDRSQVHGDAWSSDNVFCVNFNNGNVNNLNRNNKAFVRPVRSVSSGECQGVTFKQLHTAMRLARRNKRPSDNQQAFEANWIDGLLGLERQINSGTWWPQPTTCFIAQRPKARQIHAPDFSDRVVHHWLVPRLEAEYESTFIHDSYASRRGKGTHKAVTRLRDFVRQVHSGQGGGWYLQLDIANFFNSIHRPTLWGMLKKRLIRAGVNEHVLRITHALLRHPVQQQGVIHRSTAAERARVPLHKRLENAAPGCGLPIGNLSSQFFANVYLDRLDQFVKHTLKAQRYLRFVDDFVLVHRDRAVLEGWKTQIETFLHDELKLRLKDDVRLRPISAGIDFLGYIVYPTHTRVRRRVLQHAHEALRAWHGAHVSRAGAWATPADYRRLSSVWASYQGHMRHANSHRLEQRILKRQAWLAILTSTKRRFSHQLEGRRLTIKVKS